MSTTGRIGSVAADDRHGRRGNDWRSWLPVAAPIAIGCVWAASLTQLRLQEMTDLGLVSAMPPLTLLCLGALMVSFAIVLTRGPIRQAALLTHVLVLVVALYGITEFVEPIARFATVYAHVGIIQVLGSSNLIDPRINAYFDWPGFFAFADLIVKLAGWHNALPLAPWGPLAYNLLELVPLLIIFEWATDDARLKWLAVWFFYTGNWVFQDYLSPQGTAYLMWLTVLGVLLRYFCPSPRQWESAGSFRETFRRFGPASLRRAAQRMPLRPAGTYAGLLLAVVLIYAAIVTGHQLTPMPALLVVVCLAAFCGLTVRTLPVTMVVILGAWIAYMTTDYLSGHLNVILGPLGSVGSNVTAGVGSRLDGSSGHLLIVKLNIVFSFLVWGLAGIGFIRRLRAGRLELGFALVGVTPFLLPLVQPYGGEIFLRVFLFALPAAAFYAAAAFVPSRSLIPRRHVTAVLAVVGCLVLILFQFVRYGNERFANFTRADIATAAALYRIAPPGSRLIAGDENLPWGYTGYATYDYLGGLDELPAASETPLDPARVVSEMRTTLGYRGGYVVFTPSEQIFAEDFDGAPEILPAVIRYLRTDPHADLVYDRGGGIIFRIRPTS